MAELAIDTGYYESSVVPFSAQRAVNLYPQAPLGPGTLSGGALFSTPGILSLTETDGAGRGAIKFLNELYSVNGNTFYKIEEDGTLTPLGTVTGTDRVVMDQNGLCVCIIVPSGTDNTGYFYDPTRGFYEITDPTFTEYTRQEGGVTSVAYISGYFVYTTGFEFFLGSLPTAISRGQDFPPLDFATAEVKPDLNVRSFAIKNELYILGEESIEVFRVTGNEFPFVRIQGATIDKGLRSPHGIIEFDNTFFFLGDYKTESCAIWKVGRGTAQKISTDAIDNVIQQYTPEEINSVFANAYSEEGNYFVCFTFPDRTFVFDATVSAIKQRPVWHERLSNDTQWRVSTITNIYNRVLVTDLINGHVGILDRTNLQEYGEDITREFSTAYIYNNAGAFFVSQLELQTESGVGLDPVRNEGENPAIMLSISDDGGRTFYEVSERALGKFEQYSVLQRWYRLGRAETKRIFKFSITSPVRVNILRCDI
ncbi:MAG: hypothetical protein GY799_12170, partial [Desulfobulbaceae bacterium]|nr:hypothetical protein [Desulfobulbaceae bacterium]